jgi:hypothetical protein
MRESLVVVHQMVCEYMLRCRTSCTSTAMRSQVVTFLVARGKDGS